MSFFRIRTNVAALNAQTNLNMTNRKLSNSLEKLSSGLRINKAADDASGMAIADSLRAQAEALGQSMKNINNGIGIVQIADQNVKEQIRILETIKVKATQAAQDGQTTATRKAIQQDITKLMEELDNIASTTSFNGQQLLSGQFTNKKFQIGGYSNTTIGINIGATSSDKIGSSRFETGDISANKVSSGAAYLKEVSLKFLSVDGVNDKSLESVVISTSAGTGIGVLAETINKNSNITGVRASWKVQGTGSTAVASGTIKGLEINGITVGDITIQKNDKDGNLVNAINDVTNRTGVESFIDEQGRLNLISIDGRAIDISTLSSGAVLGGGDFDSTSGGVGSDVIIGRVTLTRLDARDIKVSGTNISTIGFASSQSVAEATINLRTIKGSFSKDQTSAIGANPNNSKASDNSNGLSSGVTTLRGAMVTMDIAESAQKMLDKIRSDLGSSQNQLKATLHNISGTRVNLLAAESQIRDVDFALESMNFKTYTLLAQAGTYAITQAELIQQNILKLLQ